MLRVFAIALLVATLGKAQNKDSQTSDDDAVEGVECLANTAVMAIKRSSFMFQNSNGLMIFNVFLNNENPCGPFGLNAFGGTANLVTITRKDCGIPVHSQYGYQGQFEASYYNVFLRGAPAILDGDDLIVDPDNPRRYTIRLTCFFPGLVTLYNNTMVNGTGTEDPDGEPGGDNVDVTTVEGSLYMVFSFRNTGALLQPEDIVFQGDELKATIGIRPEALEVYSSILTVNCYFARENSTVGALQFLGSRCPLRKLIENHRRIERVIRVNEQQFEIDFQAFNLDTFGGDGPLYLLCDMRACVNDTYCAVPSWCDSYETTLRRMLQLPMMAGYETMIKMQALIQGKAKEQKTSSTYLYGRKLARIGRTVSPEVRPVLDTWPSWISYSMVGLGTLTLLAILALCTCCFCFGGMALLARFSRTSGKEEHVAYYQ